jgi:5'-3' exonuclease
MSIINLVDCNNIVRVRFEKDGYALRNLFEWAFRDPEPHIFVFDGKNAKASRRAIFPGYKVGRTPAPDNFYRQLEIFQELLTYTNKVQMKVPLFEADDAIASMVFNNPTAKFRVHSNDGDFARLINENVEMTTPTLKDIPAHEIRLYKTLKGDGADKIPGVRLYGQKSWEGMTQAHKDNWYKLLAHLETLDPASETASIATGGLNLTDGQQAWLLENWRLVRSFWLVVDFLKVPAETMAQHTVVGTPRYALGDSLLKELLL